MSQLVIKKIMSQTCLILAIIRTSVRRLYQDFLLNLLFRFQLEKKMLQTSNYPLKLFSLITTSSVDI